MCYTIVMDNVYSKCSARGSQVEKELESKSFGIMDLARLIGIQPTLLNKLIQREKYGITASAQPGHGRGKERRFGEEDVYGIALVYWLFESGLRSDSIQYVLNQICGRKLNSIAADAASVILRKSTDMLVINRTPRTGYEKRPAQETRVVGTDEAARLVRETTRDSVLVLPVGRLFANLREKMNPRRGTVVGV
jgi:hypothetical protein